MNIEHYTFPNNYAACYFLIYFQNFNDSALCKNVVLISFNE